MISIWTKAEKKRERMRTFQQRRRDAGLCIDCGQPRNGASNSYCQRCKDVRKSRAHERYMIDKEIGLCHVCEKREARPGKVTCWECAVKRSSYARPRDNARYYKLKAQGLCTYCGKNPTSGGVYCDECKARKHEIAKERYNKLQKLGLCPRCGGGIDIAGYAYCSKCRKEQSVKYFVKKENEQ